MSARATQGAAGDYAADLAPDAKQPGQIRSQTNSCSRNSELTKSAKALADGFAALPAGRTTWMSAIPISQSDSRENYGAHSLRRTKASIVYKQTGNLRAVQILPGHTKIESTVRYLGVDIEDALALAEGTEV
jgi:integrase